MATCRHDVAGKTSSLDLRVEELPQRLPRLASRMVRPPLDPLSQIEPMISLIDAPTADVSSTAIRARVAAGESIAGLVPPGVQQHIEQHMVERLIIWPVGSGVT